MPLGWPPPRQIRCKGCARVNDLSLAAPSKSAAAAGAAGEYVADSGEWQPVASFECRGVEPVRRAGVAARVESKADVDRDVLHLDWLLGPEGACGWR